MNYDAPDARLHDAAPEYLRSLILRAGLSQQGAARRIGISPRMLRYYLTDRASPTWRPVPYVVQYALEWLARCGRPRP